MAKPAGRATSVAGGLPTRLDTTSGYLILVSGLSLQRSDSYV
jgi:hypothetical protein